MIDCRLRYIVKSLGIDGENLIRFEMREPELVSVELRRLADAEIGKHYVKGAILCIAVLQKRRLAKLAFGPQNLKSCNPQGSSTSQTRLIKLCHILRLVQ
jgi:hypothetical protein